MNTGIVRKIDELGRIVIPKEIRKSLNIRNGEDVQIFIRDEEIVLKKYKKLLTVKDSAIKYLYFFRKITDSTVFITDKDKIIASTVENLLGEKIDDKILNLIEERKSEDGYSLKMGNNIINKYYYALPIIIDADAIGSIIIVNGLQINEKDKLLSNVLHILLTMELS